ncbi:uncharacterized protein LOC133800121 [Humulus lupulus]|uniref:uncharacterized protein LOC133800121 n=1 Tax=Humulus lupulus TaxID=3486 RepID=UPI002B4004B7|nr:uncharacterized protein LOC133800121 [Humulus lupulus]
MWCVVYAFRKTQFHKHFENIKQTGPVIGEYLQGIGFDKWSHAYFLGNRYNIMTSNYAERFNNKIRDAKTFPVTTFVEFIRFRLQSWFSQRHDEAEKSTTKLSPLMEKYLS